VLTTSDIYILYTPSVIYRHAGYDKRTPSSYPIQCTKNDPRVYYYQSS